VVGSSCEDVEDAVGEPDNVSSFVEEPVLSVIRESDTLTVPENRVEEPWYNDEESPSMLSVFVRAKDPVLAIEDDVSPK
jgi:hypothetical protein